VGILESRRDCRVGIPEGFGGGSDEDGVGIRISNLEKLKGFIGGDEEERM